MPQAQGREVEYFDPTYKEQFQIMRDESERTSWRSDTERVLSDVAKFLTPFREKNKVLWLTEDKFCYEGLEWSLESDGFQVQSVSVDEGLSVLGQRPVDLIILGMILPNYESTSQYAGLDILRILRTGQGPNQNTPIVIHSVVGLELISEELAPYQPIAYLEGPVRTAQFLAVVKKALSSR